METLTRLVSESLARHGFDRPLDYRRLHWSHWFRCESHHRLLQVPSKPGVFALAEEIMDLRTDTAESGSQKPEAEPPRMLAVTQFYEDDDMAFVLDRMLSRNPMRDRLASGAYFIRFVVIEDAIQRRSICTALNQWMLSAAEKATGIGSSFATSLELTEGKKSGVPQACPEPSRRVSPPLRDLGVPDAATPILPITAPQQDSGAATNIHCPSPFPSGF